ncbi:MAG: methyltransferase domain-containing protein, partial [Candidatus Omnitrophica bacterium]|nr:methyltransferase domain-containing protein [Candidatus Omnitrophota bacterium]
GISDDALKKIKLRISLGIMRDVIKEHARTGKKVAEDLYLLARLEFFHGYTGVAYRWFREAAKSAPGNPYYWLSLGVASHFEERWEYAGESYQRCVETFSEYPDISAIDRERKDLAVFLKQKADGKVTINGERRGGDDDKQGAPVLSSLIFLKRLFYPGIPLKGPGGYALERAPIIEEAIFNFVPFLVSFLLLMRGDMGFVPFLVARFLSMAVFVGLHAMNWGKISERTGFLSRIYYIFFAPFCVALVNMIAGSILPLGAYGLSAPPFSGAFFLYFAVAGISVLVWVIGINAHRGVNEKSLEDNGFLPAVLGKGGPSGKKHQESSNKEEYILRELAESGDVQGAHLLEVGFGPVISHWRSLLENGVRVTAIDTDETVCERARREINGVEILNGDFIREEALEEAKFDAVYMGNVLAGTIRPEAKRRLLERSRELLKPGGKLILYDVDLEPFDISDMPGMKGLYDRIRKEVSSEYLRLKNVYFLSSNITGLVRRAGFLLEKVDAGGYILTAVPDKESTRSYMAGLSDSILWKLASFPSTLFHETGHFALSGIRIWPGIKGFFYGESETAGFYSRKYGGVLGNLAGVTAGVSGLFLSSFFAGITLDILFSYIAAANLMSIVTEFIAGLSGRGDLASGTREQKKEDLIEFLERYGKEDIWDLEENEIAMAAKTHAFVRKTTGDRDMSVEDLSGKELSSLFRVYLNEEEEARKLLFGLVEEGGYRSSETVPALLMAVANMRDRGRKEWDILKAFYREITGKDIPCDWSDLERADDNEIKALTESYTAVREFFGISPARYASEMASWEGFLRAAVKELIDKGLYGKKQLISKLLSSRGTDLNDRTIDWLLGIHGEDEAGRKGLRYLYQGNPYGLITELFSELELSEEDILYDIGSGYGRVVFTAALVSGAGKAVGVEHVRERVEECRDIAAEMDLSNVEFRRGDALEEDISDGTLFFVDLSILDGKRSPELHDIGGKITEIGRKKEIKVAAQGASREYFEEESARGNFKKIKELSLRDHNISIYRSITEEDDPFVPVGLGKIKNFVAGNGTSPKSSRKKWIISFGALTVNVVLLVIALALEYTPLRSFMDIRRTFARHLVFGTGAFMWGVSVFMGVWMIKYHPWKNFKSMSEGEKPPDKLVTEGPYRYLRHPMYFAALAACLAVTLVLGSYYGPVFAVVSGSINFLTFLLFNWLAAAEEKELVVKFGKEYESFMRKTNRWI